MESKLATKRDIETLRSELKRDLKELDLRFEARMAETKADIIRWTIGAGIFQTALIAALFQIGTLMASWAMAVRFGGIV